MSAIELVYDYFEDHVRASAQIRERRPLAFGILCFMIGGLSLFTAQALTRGFAFASFSWAALGLSLLWEVTAGFLLAAVLHLILQMGGIAGDAAVLFILLGLADLAWALCVPLLLLARALTPASAWVPTAVFFGVGLLSLGLKARGLQDNYHITSGKAWVVLGLPYLAAMAAVVLAFSLAVVGIFLEILKAFR